MRANEASILQLIKNASQFSIPIYQRTYSWTTKECLQLWDDVVNAGAKDDVPSHFMGSIVYIAPTRGGTVTAPSSLLVIDGQQRLTTLTLLIAALVGFLKSLPDDRAEPVEGFSPNKLLDAYLLNSKEKGERRYKLILSQTDKKSLMSIVSGEDLPEDRSVRVAENFGFFKERIFGNPDVVVPLCKGLSKLMVVDVELDRNYDNPQLIFESMNSTGKELSQADLIRNFVLMGLENGVQTELYRKYWRPMELSFGQETYSQFFDDFMRYYITLMVGKTPNKDAVYETFKKYSRSDGMVTSGIETLLSDIRRYSRYICSMALDSEPDPKLKEAFSQLRHLKVNVVYPFLLALYDRYDKGLLEKEDFVSIVHTVESYVFRRAVCSIPTNSLDKTFSDLAAYTRNFEGGDLPSSLAARLSGFSSYKRFPDDEEFGKNLLSVDLYSKVRTRSYCLRKLENHRRKEKIGPNEYSIEHIMPQNKDLSDPWKDDLGPEWERIHGTWLHTIGNLTLTGYNSEYSDRPFCEKRDMEGGFRSSPLKLNDGLGQVERWNEDAIKSRGEALSYLALKVWPSLEVPPEFAEINEKTSSINGNGYGIENHPYLYVESGDYVPGIRELFDSLRTEILAIDPCVTEHFLKLYVAYKADTNFVDIVPQKRGLRLSLNMKFRDLVDVKGVCRDITDVGRWGNGDVELTLSSKEEIPYVTGLIRQSFEIQMASEA
ncbi:MAG: DUF262 domain-containing protein [Synergistota bacterium]|nr:DUF262 domain-containing protein [Synergistota bacterium]